MMQFSSTSRSTYNPYLTPAEGGKADYDNVGLIFRLLCPRNPERARVHFAKLYWVGYKPLLLSFYLFCIGVTFTIIGITCMNVCTDFDRGVGFFVIGLVTILPGMYGAVTLFNYVRCVPGWHWRLLPSMD